MRGVRHIFYFLLCVSFFLQSCSLEKRHYRGGYYVHTNNSSRKNKDPRKLESENNAVSVEEVKNNIAVSKQRSKEFAKTLIAFADKKLRPFLPYQPITLPAPGDTCDTLVLKNGTEIKIKVLEITSSVVRYKHCDNPEGATFNVSLSNVAMILYKNGTKEEFKVEPPPVLGVGPGGAHIDPSSGNSDTRSMKKRSNSALIFGILSFPGTLLFLVGGIIFAILAISFGGSAIRTMRKNPLLHDDTNMTTAKAGLIFGIVYLSLVLLLILIFIAALIYASGTFFLI